MSVGGPIISNLGLLSELVEQDCSVKVLTTNRNGLQRMKIKHKVKNGININYFPSFWNHRFSIKLLVNIIREIKRHDIVHVDDVFSFYTITALLINIILKKKFVFSPRGTLISYVFKKEQYFKRLVKILFLKILVFFIRKQSKFAFHFTSNKEKNEAERILSVFNLGKQKSLIVPNGFKLNSKMKEKKIILKDVIKIVTLGRINRKKRLELAILAIKCLIKKGYKVQYNIIGNDDDGSIIELKNLIRKLQLKKHVFFHKPIFTNLKFKFLKRHNIFLLTSKSENFGNVVLEALSVQLPIVLTNNLPWEILRDTSIGTITKSSPISISEGIALQMTKNYRCKDFESFIKKFDWTLLSKKFLKEIREF